MSIRTALLSLIVWVSLVPAAAAQPPGEENLGEPEVTIVEREEGIVEEYRINGQLYMVKVTPKKGPPYYLTDTDGDGQLDRRDSELDPAILVPRWVIFRW